MMGLDDWGGSKNLLHGKKTIKEGESKTKDTRAN
jgi:hypothetical protein